MKPYLVSSGIIAILVLLYSFGAFSGLQESLHDPLHGYEVPQKILILAIDDVSLKDIGRWPWERDVYEQIIPKLTNATAVGIDITFFEETEKDDALAKAIEDAGNVVLASEYSLTSGELLNFDLIEPLSTLNAESGIINIITDSDGVARALRTKDSLPLLSEVVTGISAPDKDRLLINFAGPPKTFQYVSASDVYFDRIDMSLFEDAIVFMGATAPDLQDNYFVPTSKGQSMPGVEVHANAASMMMNEKYVFNQNPWVIALTIILTGWILSFTLKKYHAGVVGVCAFVFLIIYGLSAVLFFNKGLSIDLVFTPLTVLFILTGHVMNLYVFEEKERKQIQEAFGKYVAPDVIEDLMKNREKLKLGGEKREITVFFSDIRGFTSISEALSPEALVDLLNEYLTSMTDIIMDSRGVVDKYMGDAIMAFWGAPVDMEDHADRAAEASIKQMDRLREMQNKWKEEGVPQLDIGIGLNTGHAVVGNMGSHQRFDYTAMGDTINLGSRLEGLNKPYKTNIIVSENTKKKLSEKFIVRKLDLVAVKGKKEPVMIFELVGRSAEVSDERKKVLKTFEKGFDLYREKKFKEAKEEFDSIQDGPAKVFSERCDFFLNNPPEESWDGVWVMTTK